MLRSLIASFVVVAGILSLGVDLAQTAYHTAQTARIVVIARS